MKATMSDYGLLPSSNLLTDENKERLFHYWNALRAEWISHLVNHGEALPAAQINKRLELEFSMSIERLGELWLEGAEFVEGPIDETKRNRCFVRSFRRSKEVIMYLYERTRSCEECWIH